MFSEDIENWNELLVGESLLLGMLGKALYGEPDIVWLDQLISEDIFSEPILEMDEPEVTIGLEILNKWTSENRKGLSDEAIDMLQRDFMVLFVGPGKLLAPPYESVYFGKDRLVFQERTFQIREIYRIFGLEIELGNHEPDDHIGLEISFVSYLAKMALQGLQEGDEKKFNEYIVAKSRFLSEHLLQWSAAWSALVINHAKSDFYRGIGYLTTGSLSALAKKYGLLIESENIR